MRLLMCFMVMPSMAQEAMEFQPEPVTVRVGDVDLDGILIDESDYEEMGRNRILVKTQSAEISALESHIERKEEIWLETRQSLRDQHKKDLDGMRELYLSNIEAASERTFREKYGLEVGIGIGVVTTVAAIVTTGYALGQASK